MQLGRMHFSMTYVKVLLLFPEFLFVFIAGFESKLWNITEQKIVPQDGWKLIKADCQGAGLQTRYYHIICNYQNEKCRTVGLYVLCGAIKWPFLRHPLGNNSMSVNVKDNVRISPPPPCFLTSPLLLDKVDQWCQEVRTTLAPVAAAMFCWCDFH